MSPPRSRALAKAGSTAMARVGTSLKKKRASRSVAAKPRRLPRRETERTAVLRWWNGLSGLQRTAVVFGGVAAIGLTGGAAAWGIASVSGGLIVMTGGTTVALGAVAKHVAKHLGKLR